VSTEKAEEDEETMANRKRLVKRMRMQVSRRSLSAVN
jgi:hypothetical protein